MRHTGGYEQHVAGGGGTFVALTEEGWDVLVAAAPLHVESVRRHFIDLLTPEQLGTLHQIDTVIQHLAAQHKCTDGRPSTHDVRD